MVGRVVAVAGDPGGADAVGPVLAALRAAGRPVTALAYAQAGPVWARRGVPSEPLPPTPDAAALLAGAGALLTATSCNGLDLEKPFRAAARRLGVPSVAVLDAWSNYVARFAGPDGRLDHLPDRVAVMDAQARDEMIAAGFDPGRVTVTGQPAFDDLAARRAAFDPARRAAARGRLGVGPDERLVLFASQPLAALCGSDPSHPDYWGYTEQTVLALLTAALDRIVRRRRTTLTLVVRPHPREDAGTLRGLTAGAARVVVDGGGGDGPEVALTADLVTGITSVLLVHACLLGCVVLSLQPGLRRGDVLPTNRAGRSRAAYRPDEIEPAVEALLFDPTARVDLANRARAAAPPGDAAGRVIRLLDSLQGGKA